MVKFECGFRGVLFSYRFHRCNSSGTTMRKTQKELLCVQAGSLKALGQRSAFRLLPVIELFMLRRTDTGDDDDDHYSYTLLERLCISHSSE